MGRMLGAVAKRGVPRSIGRYEIRKELGRGTMGVVYEAWDPVLDRTVALKTIGAQSLSRAERKTYEKRFLTEARAAARLSHPGIVVVHDVGRDSDRGLLYMALERLEGETLADLIASGRRVDWREALRITGRVAAALHHAHTQGVVHRDVKPANIMVLRSGEPKIMDFGIARVDAGHLTTPGELFGTPLYMAPEQALGRPVDARADLFSLGTIAYTLLTGRAPFAAPSVPAILARVAHRSAPPPSELVPGLPPAVDDVLARAMAKAPEDRYPTGQMMEEDVQDVQAGRPPRHRAAWKPTPKGERTFTSPAVGDVPDLDLVEDAPARPRRPRRWRSRLERLVLLALTGAAAVHFWDHPEDLGYWQRVGREGQRLLSGLMTPAPPEASPVPPTPSPTAEQTAVPTPAAAPVASPESSPGTAAAGPAEGTTEPPGDVSALAMPTELAPSGSGAPASTQPEPTPTPPSPALPADVGADADARQTASAPAVAEEPALASPATPRKEKAKEKASSPAPRKAPPVAWLSIGFEHHLTSGTLEVWVDDKRVAKEALDSRVTRKLLGFELRSGSVQQTLGLDPGRHEVRVRLRSGDDDRTARSSTTFRAGTTRRLEVKASRLRGGLTLEWK
jgi:serine/threonine protein kinase